MASGCLQQRMSLLGIPPIVNAEDQWGLLAVTSCAALAGIKLEKTAIGRALSGAVCAMLISSLLVSPRQFLLGSLLVARVP